MNALMIQATGLPELHLCSRPHLNSSIPALLYPYHNWCMQAAHSTWHPCLQAHDSTCYPYRNRCMQAADCASSQHLFSFPFSLFFLFFIDWEWSLPLVVLQAAVHPPPLQRYLQAPHLQGSHCHHHPCLQGRSNGHGHQRGGGQQGLWAS